MTRSGKLIVTRIPLIATIIMLTITLLNVSPVSSAPSYLYSWQDEFESTTLAPQWSWVREDSDHWSLTASPGDMRIITQPGGVYGTSGSNNQKNLLLLPAPDPDFEIITQVTIDPSEDFQHAALIVYQDDDNYVEINRAYTGGNTVNFDAEYLGLTSNGNASETATTLCLRITSNADTYTGFYSTDPDCSSWTSMGSYTIALSNVYVGIAASNGPSTTGINADFNSFQINTNQSIYDYYWDEYFSSTDLHPLWSWVREDGTHWSLNDNPGNMRITTQTGGIFEVTGSNNQQNILLMQAPQNDLQLTTLVTIDPSENFQHAALLVYEDDDNYVEINRAYADGDYVDFDIEIGGVVSSTSVAVTADTLYLRIVRVGNVYSGYYSLDGVVWEMVDSGTADLSGAMVGLGASSGASSTEITADFDEFHLEGNFPEFSTAWSDEFSSTLQPSWWWVNENPTTMNLNTTGYMMISTAPYGVGGENLLVQKMPLFDFWMETHVIFEPTSNFQIASLVIFGDEDNYLSFGRAYCDSPACAGNAIYYDYVKSGAGEGSNFQTSVTETDEAYLRVLREGSTFFGFYRNETSKWLLIGSHDWDAPVDADSIGITAAQGYAGYEDAYFDYFHINGYTTPYDYYWDEDFSSMDLHPLWSWVREDGTHWSLNDNPGNMRITTQTGGIFEVTGSNNQQNILLMQAPQNDLQVTTLVTIDPSENFQHAALLIYEDDDNYVEINRSYSFANGVSFDIEIGGVASSTAVALIADTLYLRIVRVGNLYSGYYSLDGVEWMLLDSGTADLSGAMVGLGASSGASSTEITADFDEFHLEGNFPSFNSIWSDDFDSTSLNSKWWWINENPANWSLTEASGYMGISTAPYGVGGENLLVQKMPAFDFWMETHVYFEPTSNFQIASLVLFGDDDSMLSFGRAYCDVGPCVGNGLYFDHTEDGVFSGINFATPVPEMDEAYLRVLREGSTYYGFYRSETSKWLLIGTHVWGGAVDLSAIGITAAQGNAGYADAFFDNVVVTPALQSFFIPILVKP
jgi:hypothetical protein